MASQRSDQPVLSRILVEAEPLHSGTKRQPRRVNTLVISAFLSGDVGINLHLYNFRTDTGDPKPSGSIGYEIDKAGSGEKILNFSEEAGTFRTPRGAT
jgi:hypothetical protein